MEKSDGRCILFSSLKIWIDNGASDGATIKSASKRINDAFVQERVKSYWVEIADG